MGNSLSIGFSKSGEIWHGSLFELTEPKEGVLSKTVLLDEVEADSYGGLTKEMANKGWIDLLNKNENGV